MLTDVRGVYGYNRAESALLQPDGKLVVVGCFTGYSSAPGGGYNYNFLVVRYNPDGSLDTNFGNGGYVLVDLGNRDFAYAVALRGDGKILVGGVSDGKIALVQLDSSGQFDPNFGSLGRTVLQVNGEIRSMKLTEEGRILVAGKVGSSMGLLRFNSDGTLDPTFANGGVALVSSSENSIAYFIALQSDGKIIVGGAVTDPPNTQNIALARFYSNGNIDLSFGNNGLTITDLGGSEELRAGLVTHENKLLGVGQICQGSNCYFLVLRYNL